MNTGKLSPDRLKQRLRTIELLSLDVDGVLTDGGLYYSDDGHQMRKFNVKDGMGIVRAMQSGIEVCLITASKADVIAQRARDLGVKYVFPATDDKLLTLAELCGKLALDIQDVAHIGDDVNDLPLLKAVGLSLTVADAVPEVLEVVDYAASKDGGKGAVREICDLIVSARSDHV